MKRVIKLYNGYYIDAYQLGNKLLGLLQSSGKVTGNTVDTETAIIVEVLDLERP